jgi:hypothetical protein
MIVLFRMYGHLLRVVWPDGKRHRCDRVPSRRSLGLVDAACRHTIALGSAMRYDWIVNAIGPFEVTEYLGLVAVWGALAVTAPFLHASDRCNGPRDTRPSSGWNRFTSRIWWRSACGSAW